MDYTPPLAREGERAAQVATRRSISSARCFAEAREVGALVREYCELCRVPMSLAHQQLLDKTTHRIVGACDACALRCEMEPEGRYDLIPHDTLSLSRDDLKNLHAFHHPRRLLTREGTLEQLLPEHVNSEVPV